MTTLPNILAVDVGYGNTKVYGTAVGDRNREQGFHFPSMALRVSGREVTCEVGSRHQVVRVYANNQEYFVGRDTPLLVNVNQPYRSSLEREYPLTPEYLALLLGALHGSKLPHVDVLALGLPAQFSQDEKLANDMQDRFLGEHLCGDRRISVREVRVYSQPVGGLASFVFEEKTMDFIKQNLCLCIDPGFNTVDWTIINGGKVVRTMNDSVQGGMAVYLAELQGLVRRKWPELVFDTTYFLDAAARGEKGLMYGGKAIDISHEVEIAMGSWNNAIAAMVGTVGSLRRFGGIFVVGGAAVMFGRALQARYPDIEVRVSDVQPILANARGFFVMGRNAWHNSATVAGSLPRGHSPAATASVARAAQGTREVARV